MPAQLHPDIEEAWDDFRRSLARKGRSAETVVIYRKSFEQFWTWATKDGGLSPDPGAVTHRQINGWVDSMLGQPAVRGGRTPVLQYEVDPVTGEKVVRKVAVNTIRIRWQNLRPFFSWWAAETEERNPFDKADVPRLEELPVPVVTMSDLKLLLHVCDGTGFEARRDTALIRFLVDTGARVGELVSMTVDSWDRRHDVAMLVGKTGTRAVPLSASTGESLTRYVRARKTHPQTGLPALWLGLRGKLGTGGVAQVLYRRCDQAGIPRIHPHIIRHTWAHEMKSADASEGDLMALGGWSTPAMVHRYGKSAAVSRAHATGRRIALGDRL